MSRYFIVLLVLFASACYRVPDRINPRVDYVLQDLHFTCLKSAFPPISPIEKGMEWAKEFHIAQCFAEQLDLYRAVSTFKRALILLPSRDTARRHQIQYDIVLCFFLGKRYDEAIENFEQSALACVDKTFPAYHDLLLILYECYREMDNPEKQQCILELIDRTYPETGEKLKLSRALREGDLDSLKYFAEGFPQDSYLDQLIDNYQDKKKSVDGAQALNAILPGAGYFYLGQTKSGVTALLLNGLFIAAAVEFFKRKLLPAGLITVGFEAGWYFGGIYGAGEEAKYYNERIYEKQAQSVLNEHKLFPVLMLDHAF